jgi:hypothetical protein
MSVDTIDNVKNKECSPDQISQKYFSSVKCHFIQD